MDISGIRKADYFFADRTGRAKRNRENTGYLEIAETVQKHSPQENMSIRTKSSLMDIYDRKPLASIAGWPCGPTDTGEAKTDTDIIVKPDGSRVLVVTTNIGSMETTMSLEISKPTDMDNEIHNDEKMDDSVEKGEKTVTIETEV